MALLDYIDTPSPIHRFDPRARLIVSVLLLPVIALANRPGPLMGTLLAVLLLIGIFRLPLRTLGRRLLALNTFLALWWITAAWLDPDPGTQIVLLGALKANAMLLLLSLLVSTIDLVSLGHALAHLRVPGKLVHLFLFTVRYTEVLWIEHQRMQRALRARAFRPRVDAHTYRTLSRLVGMLLVRSLDRADRVLAAMRCRGYRGQFHLLHHFHYHRRDVWFTSAGLATALLLAWSAWS